MNEQDRAIVRQFMATDTGKRWLEEARNSYHVPELGKVPMDAYHAALLEAQGWAKCVEWLRNSSREILVPHYGIQPIETTKD